MLAAHSVEEGALHDDAGRPVHRAARDRSHDERPVPAGIPYFTYSNPNQIPYLTADALASAAVDIAERPRNMKMTVSEPCASIC